MSAMCLAVITLAALAVAPVTSVSPNDAVHVGCFKTNLVDTQRSYYMVNESLSWENGISACIHRYTTHVGVQADNRVPSKSYFFCGNDLLDHSDKLEDSACERCDGTDRHCGGPQSISIYKIRDSTPLVIVLAEHTIIRLLEVDGSHRNYSRIIRTPYIPYRIIKFYSRDEIVLQKYSGSQIYKSFFDHQIQEYSTPSAFEAYPYGLGLAVDSVHEKLYYCEENGIMEHDMKTETTRNIYRIKLKLISDLAIDPYTRTLFTVFENGTLSAFSLLTQSYRTYTGGENGLHHTHRVAVDVESQIIYVITTLTADNNTKYLAHLDYNLENLTILHHNTGICLTCGLDVFNGSVFWTAYYGGLGDRAIYSCKPSPICNQENVKRLQNATSYVYDIFVYHPVKQTPTEKYLCSTAGCTHGCYRRTLFTAQCTCPEGLILSTDNATCQESINIRETTAAPVTESTDIDHDKKMQINETEETKHLSLPDVAAPSVVETTGILPESRAIA